MSTFLGGSEVSGMYLGSNEISEMYLGSNLIYSSWPYKTLRISKDGGITWEDHGRPDKVARSQFRKMEITHVELPDSITSIESFAFLGNTIRTVLIPEPVKTIGSEAFRENWINRLELPETLVSIGTGAFRYNSLRQVEFPETLEKINQGAFRDNYLSEVRLSRQTTYERRTSSWDSYPSFDNTTKIILY